ncbi:MAG TPA: hypothetical protein VIQ51_03170, partial [Chryseosolibacter sp.]
GMFGLALVDSKNTRVKWHAVLTEIIAIGLLTYAVLINQLGWFMTPPRSEMWAACLGAAIALAWYIVRHRHNNVLKVAVWSALGAGFGFAFGNFLQVMGSISGIEFNFWNVMEYSIGFFGGIGMAFGTFTSSWPVVEEKTPPNSNLIPILFVALFIPFVVWDQSFVVRRFNFILESGGSPGTIFTFQLLAILFIAILAGRILYRNYAVGKRNEIDGARAVVREFFILYSAVYIFLSFLITGVVVHPPEQYLYVLNLLLILVLISKASGSFSVLENKPRIWLRVAMIAIVAIALMALVAINSHDGMPGSQMRFGAVENDQPK